MCGAVVDRTKPIWDADTAIRLAINLTMAQKSHLQLRVFILLSAQKGYTLGSPEKRAIPLPERGLSAVSCLVIRLLMHSVLVWSSCTNEVWI